jgi:hypothetical protein
MNADTVKHPPFKEGSRTHVSHYTGGIGADGKWTAWRVCSEPRCELNVKHPQGPKQLEAVK